MPPFRLLSTCTEPLHVAGAFEQLSFIFSFTGHQPVHPVLLTDAETHRYDCARKPWLCASSTRCASVYWSSARWWLFNGMANNIFRLFKIPMVRKDDITSDDIYAVVEASALAGVLRKQEHELIKRL